MAKTATTTNETPCACGCGGSPKKGQFLPGHDARLKSQLRAVLESGTAAQKAKAEAELAARGWNGSVKPAKTKTAKAKAKA